MKQARVPPKTGETFAVIFQDVDLEHWSVRYNKDYEVFERNHNQLGWIVISGKSEKRYLEDVLIYVKD